VAAEFFLHGCLFAFQFRHVSSHFRRADQTRPLRAFCLRCALTNSCGEPIKELNCNHGVLISDQQFDVFLKCRTKAHFTFSSARTGEPSHPISDWQGHIAENYQKNCRDYLRSVSGADCFIGTPHPADLRNAKYPLILQPLITAQDAESHVHALERGVVPSQKGRSAYVPIRFVPFEKISKHYKLMLAFDALVLWKASGQMPTKGTIIHGLQHTILRLRLDTLIQEVQSLEGKLRALLSESSPPDPVLIKHCLECEFETYCRKRVTEKDDLSLLDC
jgi:predicted RecB family nuclease